ncbi:MFS transporter [Ornithinimicrobium faecis]|uniref:MFS transporter n=1 Tax=Ornithinimicrobium faecis TaxID=2934158 RepID=A0ABY4YYS2_9MICO|nr:MFS transporter [Ornithinimicrobium sp. HY1793]USQ81410.1 MFS transporter [Ornithinimicrobium sp. HY1793]
MRQFRAILVNTLVANVTTSFLWFAVTFWVYLGTRSVLATALIGGAFMLLVAATGIPFGTYVDRTRKRAVMVTATLTTLVAFIVGGLIYATVGPAEILDMTGPWFWLFTGVILFGGVVENARNIALSTTVTLLVATEDRARANGLVGTVQGVSLLVTSVFSGLAVGFLGMGWTIVIAICGLTLSAAHLLQLSIDEPRIVRDPDRGRIDLSGSITAIRVVPGLAALIAFAAFNNLLGGVYMSLMDPYGLELFSVQAWGLVFGLCATGFIVGGALIARYGLGANPLRTMLWLLVAMGLVAAVFTVREVAWLYVAGIWLYMAFTPAVEAGEQTVIQRVVPLRQHGRVFGLAQAVEAGAAPVSAFLIGPVVELGILPWSRSAAGQAALEPWLGTGQMRGIALVLVVSGLVLTLAAVLAFRTQAYGRLSAVFRPAGGVAGPARERARSLSGSPARRQTPGRLADPGGQ